MLTAAAVIEGVSLTVESQKIKTKEPLTSHLPLIHHLASIYLYASLVY
jgi:hypothetical protein